LQTRDLDARKVNIRGIWGGLWGYPRRLPTRKESSVRFLAGRGLAKRIALRSQGRPEGEHIPLRLTFAGPPSVPGGVRLHRGDGLSVPIVFRGRSSDPARPCCSRSGG
jgi:hypothetical protein